MRTIRLLEFDDFKPFLPSGFTETTDGATIPDNTYAWNTTYKALRINDASAALKGSIQIPYLAKSKIGDVIEIQAEIMNVSGEKGKIAIDYNGGGNMFILQTEKTGEFEKIGGRFVIPLDKELIGVFGVFTADIGDFYIRNVEVKVINQSDDIVVPDIRAYTFLFNAASLDLTSFHPYTCTTNVTSTEVTITHDTPFTGQYAGTAFAHVSATGVDKIIAKTRSESLTGLVVEFVDVTTGANIDPTTLYGTTTYFSVVHHGYK